MTCESISPENKKISLRDLVEKVRVLEPFIPGVNHYVTIVWLAKDGKYYITSQYGKPFPNGPGPTEYISWEDVEIIGGPFNTYEEAVNWFYRGIHGG